MTTLDERLAQCVRESGRNESEIAKAAGVTPQAVHAWANGETRRIRPENLFPLARYLGVNAEWLGTGAGPKYPTEAQQNLAPYQVSIPEKHRRLLTAFDRLSPATQGAALALLESIKES